MTDFHYRDSTVDATGQVIATVGTYLIAAVALGLVIRLSVQRRAVWPIVLTAGGTMTCLMEPLFDHLYGLWFPTQGQWHLFTVYGVSEPVWLPGAYLIIYGALAVLTVVWLQKDPSVRTVWRMYGVLVAVAMVGEIVYIQVLGVYNYQGGQSFVVLGYPLFLGFVNAMSAVMTGIVVWRLLPLLGTPGSQLGLFMLPPLAFALDAVGAGIFYLSVRHSPDPSSFWLHVTAITVALGGAGTVHLLSYLVRGTDRAQAGNAVASPGLRTAS
jgi:hypothetical protein